MSAAPTGTRDTAPAVGHDTAPAVGHDTGRGELPVPEAIRLVQAATSPAELFGAEAPVRRYRRLARALHPDRLAATPLGAAQRAAAAAAFARLTLLWDSRHPVLRTGSASYRLTQPRHHGDLADLYPVGAGQLLKLPRDPRNNDLLERETRALRILATRGEARHRPYVPRLADSFRHEDPATGARRQVNVLATPPGLHSLAEVRAAYPSGLDLRDVAWMWRRLLVALGFAHQAGLVHGAVLPGHVLIEPELHGLVLVDWCYSTTEDEPVPARVPTFADWYPPEVSRREPATAATDIAMATRCMAYLLDQQAPAPVRVFIAGCSQPSPRQRPDDAWRLLAELDELLGRLYGPRRFRPFHLPRAAPTARPGTQRKDT